MGSTHRRAGWRCDLTSNERQLLFLRETVRAGSIAMGAHRLGVSDNHLKNTLHALYGRLGVHSIHEALYVLWLRHLWGDV